VLVVPVEERVTDKDQHNAQLSLSHSDSDSLPPSLFLYNHLILSVPLFHVISLSITEVMVAAIMVR
jgi:hypothetical protein